MIVYITEMLELPANCMDCAMMDCELPLKAKRYEAEIKKRYMSKRHPDCPLREISIHI